jgi:hypothetical protein
VNSIPLTPLPFSVYLFPKPLAIIILCTQYYIIILNPIPLHNGGSEFQSKFVEEKEGMKRRVCVCVCTGEDVRILEV